ncbi:Uncharacterised protein [Vibrio cholerae]|nr:Uncharacterised protein [Vibrio cholerae]
MQLSFTQPVRPPTRIQASLQPKTFTQFCKRCRKSVCCCWCTVKSPRTKSTFLTVKRPS